MHKSYQRDIAFREKMSGNKIKLAKFLEILLIFKIEPQQILIDPDSNDGKFNHITISLEH